MRLFRIGWLLAASVAATSAGPIARPSDARADPATVLLELFTSEGCSSCPPADQLLIDLVRTQPVAGVHIVALSEHVDYWNRLGWTDPFSSAQFTDRQTAYGRALGDEAYTPQAVIDGRAAVVGSSRAEVLAAIRAAAAHAKASIDLSWTPDLRIALVASPAAANADVYLAITEDGLSSNVRRGENEGHQLAHDAVTRRLTRIGATSRQGSFSQTVPIAPMLDPSWRRNALRVVVFVQSKAAVVAVETSNLQLTTNR
jgi:hypothetical protein